MRWKHQIAAWHLAHVSNGPTEAVNNLIKRVKRAAFGFTSFRDLPDPLTALRRQAQLGPARDGHTPLEFRSETNHPIVDRGGRSVFMPGLLRGIARTAVIAGTATAVSNNVSRRQANRWSQQEQQPQPAPAPPAPPAVTAPTVDVVAQLKGLADLKNQGILTDAEFDAQKAKILAM